MDTTEVKIPQTLPSQPAIMAACLARAPHLMIQAELNIPEAELLSELLAVAFAAGMVHAGADLR